MKILRSKAPFWEKTIYNLEGERYVFAFKVCIKSLYDIWKYFI